MTERQRQRRQDPERTGPVRNWGTLFKSSRSGAPLMGADDTGNREQGEATWDSAVSRAVEMGYKVIEDQITQGRQIAEQLSRGAFNTGPDDAFGPDGQHTPANDLIERLMHFYSDMGSLCFEMLETVTSNPAFADLLRGGMAAGAARPGTATRTQDSGSHTEAVTIEILATQPTGARATLEWVQPPTGRMLAVAQLSTLPPQPATLTGIEYVAATDDWQALLRIPIPPGQPPGNYSGVVVDASTNQPCATLSLMIPAATTNGTG